ncbi:homoserine dehydrogenase [Horticoccus luteus]|uniref:Homoserine dehydrogenase n=1 Tax=Horticoccus luteus TaxID=2862869 RepID=A0A8F9XMX4_9BACT|nr:homoserine dehydrogenase [Horticoccus luteus]QYM80544.1 homoserine dehydrogenase [Horticoccus luteus]
MSVRTLRIGLCGLGTVGQGVWKHLTADRPELEARLGVKLELARGAVRNPKKRRSVRIPASKLTTDALAIARDPSIDIVCELVGGTDLAREITLEALRRGKVVVSANKALICAHGAEIFATAREHGGRFLFEASVAGGIPIIKALREGLVANRFPLIYGILNGTCNYILTQMEERDAPYTQVLGDAKRLGYAEADESLDVEGWDAAHKASVLAYLAHGVWVRPEQMIVEGIARITPADFKNANALGFGIKLLAVIWRDFETNELSVRVHPTLLPESHVVAKVNGVFNAISVQGDVVGTTLYIGRGAGQDATASAVISDIVDAVALLRRQKGEMIDGDFIETTARRQAPPRIAPPEHIEGRYYLRLTVEDKPGVLSAIAAVTARQHVSIASVIQSPAERAGAASLVLTTHRSNERALRNTIARLRRLRPVLEEPVLLRIAEFPE